MGSLFRNHSPATILHDKKDTQAAILVRGRTRLSPQRPDDARPGTRLLPQPGPSRYKSRNPGTPIRNRDGGIADRTSHNAILFPGSDLHRPPGCFRDTPHPAPAVLCIIRKSKCSTDFKRNDFLKKTKRTHWVRFVHLNSLIESCVFLYLWNSPFDTFL